MTFIDPRLTERRNARTAAIDLATPLEIVDLINAEDRTVPEIVGTQREAIARAIETAEATFRRGGRLFYVGAGTSGRLGVLDASECPPTYGTDPEMVQGIIAGGPLSPARRKGPKTGSRAPSKILTRTASGPVISSSGSPPPEPRHTCDARSSMPVS
jgi:N-acetylmuramic acid 6-phosphate (MurNAc-6-P) etherase